MCMVSCFYEVVGNANVVGPLCHCGALLKWLGEGAGECLMSLERPRKDRKGGKERKQRLPPVILFSSFHHSNIALRLCTIVRVTVCVTVRVILGVCYGQKSRVHFVKSAEKEKAG